METNPNACIRNRKTTKKLLCKKGQRMERSTETACRHQLIPINTLNTVNNNRTWIKVRIEVRWTSVDRWILNVRFSSMRLCAYNRCHSRIVNHLSVSPNGQSQLTVMHSTLCLCGKTKRKQQKNVWICRANWIQYECLWAVHMTFQLESVHQWFCHHKYNQILKARIVYERLPATFAWFVV